MKKNISVEALRATPVLRERARPVLTAALRARPVLLAALLALCTVGVYAQQLTVAVTPFETRSGFTPEDAETIYELFVSDLVGTGRIKVVDRNSFDKIREQMDFELSDWPDSAKVAQFGKALNANSIIRGSLMSLGGKLIITASIIDINTAQVLSSSRLQFGNVFEAIDKMPELTRAIVASLPDPPGVYRVGGRGPAGGIIFYDKGAVTNGWRYLEAGLTDFTSVQWGPEDKEAGGTEGGIGSGKRNTEIIVAFLRKNGETGRAAQLCADYDLGGYQDWFLPSKDELNLMYTNLKQKGLGGFDGDGSYWSSSEDYGSHAWYQMFSDGIQYDYYKYRTYSVRAVRMF